MAKRAPRDLRPPRIDLNGWDERFRVIDRDFETSPHAIEDVEWCRLANQPITKLPARFGPALRELTLERCEALPTLAGIERCTGLASLSFAGFGAAWIARELERVMELPDLSQISVSNASGSLAFEPIAALPGLISAAIDNCTYDQAAAFGVLATSPTLRRLRLERLAPWILGEGLAALAELRGLEVVACTEIPRAIGALGKLERLVIDGERYKQRTKLRKLPAELGRCSALVELHVTGPIAALPEQVCRCTRLEVLALHRTQIAALPEGIGRLAKLRRLDVAGTEIARLPDSIGELAELRVLAIPRRVSATPGTVERLALEEFTGDETIGIKIPRLPPPAPETDEVVLGDAARIPADFGDPRRLTLQLAAHAGPLPQLRHLRKLVEASLAVGDLGDALVGLAHLTHLERLAVYADAVPPAIGALRTVKHLALRGDITELPDALGELAALESLSLECPRLARVPDVLGELPRLETVSIGAVGFSEFPATLARSRSLAHVRVRAGARPVRDLRALGNLVALRHLEFDMPDIPAFPALLEMLAATPLETLELSHYAGPELPEEVGALPRLASLDLRRTKIARLPGSLRTCFTLRAITLPRPEFAGDPREHLAPGRWSLRAWRDHVRCERYRGANRT